MKKSIIFAKLIPQDIINSSELENGDFIGSETMLGQRYFTTYDSEKERYSLYDFEGELCEDYDRVKLKKMLKLLKTDGDNIYKFDTFKELMEWALKMEPKKVTC